MIFNVMIIDNLSTINIVRSTIQKYSNTTMVVKLLYPYNDELGFYMSYFLV